MQMEIKIVEFDKYCKLCKYTNMNEDSDPCHECLGNPTRPNSHKPVMFKEK